MKRDHFPLSGRHGILRDYPDPDRLLSRPAQCLNQVQ
jgi:hypothetical protein